ncbi:MAG: nitrogen regulation protein NR(I) [Pseudomonadota bacterium]
MNKRILLADDDDTLRAVLARSLEHAGYDVTITADGAEALEAVRTGVFDAAVLDIMMPHLSGLDVMSKIRPYAADMPVILISANASFTTAIKTKQAGAFDYLPKPFDLTVLNETVDRACASVSATKEMSEEVVATDGIELLGKSPAMQVVFRTISRLTQSDLSVLITGESGTGKEVVARMVHQHSKRKNKPFVAINMAAIPSGLIESELFGHEKGAFTGADRRKTGRFEQAAGGTLFFDEIGDMPLEAQTRLLRVLQEEEFSPLGSERVLTSDVRIICATHRNLKKRVAEGKFREDLYYRLNVIPIMVPPLRERREDIPDLARHFLKQLDTGLCFSDAALKALQDYDWSGNIRELKNLIARLSVLSPDQKIGSSIVRQELTESTASPVRPDESIDFATDIAGKLEEYFDDLHQNARPGTLYPEVISNVERPLIELTLKATNGNQIQAARILGLNRNTLRSKIRALDLNVVRK